MIGFLIYITLVVACLVAYQLNRQQLPSSFRYLQYLLACVVTIELAKRICGYLGYNNNFLNHIYQPLELLFLSILYYKTITIPFFRKVLIIAVSLVIPASVFASLWIEGLEERNTISFILGSMLIIPFSVTYKYQLFNLPPTRESLLVNPFFWINTAHLFYFCGTFLPMGLDTYFRRRNIALTEELNIISYVLNYTLYTLYLIGILCNRIFKSY